MEVSVEPNEEGEDEDSEAEMAEDEEAAVKLYVSNSKIAEIVVWLTVFSTLQRRNLHEQGYQVLRELEGRRPVRSISFPRHARFVSNTLFFLSLSVPYAALAQTFDAIGATTKRLEITALLTHFLVDVIERTPGDLIRTVYLCINRVCRLS